MIRALLILMAGISGAAAFDAKLFLDFESGNNNDAADAAYFNAMDKGTPPADWVLTGSAGTVSTSANKPLFTPALVEGTSYTGAGTRCLVLSRSSQHYYQFTFPSGQRTNAGVMSFWLRVTGLRDGFFDLATMTDATGQSATFQLGDDGYIPHTDFGGGAGLPINVDHTEWHFFNICWRMNGGNMDLYCWDGAGVLKGQESWPITSTAIGLTSISFGNRNPHGEFPAGDLQWDSVAIWWSDEPNITIPIGQPGVGVTYTSDGRSASSASLPL